LAQVQPDGWQFTRPPHLRVFRLGWRFEQKDANPVLLSNLHVTASERRKVDGIVNIGFCVARHSDRGGGADRGLGLLQQSQRQMPE